jgi:hypothetical protein
VGVDDANADAVAATVGTSVTIAVEATVGANVAVAVAEIFFVGGRVIDADGAVGVTGVVLVIVAVGAIGVNVHVGGRVDVEVGLLVAVGNSVRVQVGVGDLAGFAVVVECRSLVSVTVNDATELPSTESCTWIAIYEKSTIKK